MQKLSVEYCIKPRITGSQVWQNSWNGFVVCLLSPIVWWSNDSHEVFFCSHNTAFASFFRTHTSEVVNIDCCRGIVRFFLSCRYLETSRQQTIYVGRIFVAAYHHRTSLLHCFWAWHSNWSIDLFWTDIFVRSAALQSFPLSLSLSLLHHEILFPNTVSWTEFQPFRILLMLPTNNSLHAYACVMKIYCRLSWNLRTTNLLYISICHI